MAEYAWINNLHSGGRYTSKNLYGKYIDTVNNIGVNLTYCIVCEVWVSTGYPFKASIFTTLPLGGEGNGKEN